MALRATMSLDITKLGRVTPATTRALAAGLYREAQNILTESREQCPVDMGPLRASGYVLLPVVTQDYITVELGYTAEYAVVQHERLDYNHTVGKAKYLEDPMNARLPSFQTRMASEIIPTLSRL